MKSKTSKKAGHPTGEIPVVHPNVAGVDLGATEHYVCAPTGNDGQTEVRHFGTTTPQLRLLVAWLRDCGVESVAMESTGVYWIPLYEMLEEEKITAFFGGGTLYATPARSEPFI